MSLSRFGSTPTLLRIAVSLLCVLPACSDDPPTGSERSFDPLTPGQVVSGELPVDGQHTYILRADPGQTLIPVARLMDSAAGDHLTFHFDDVTGGVRLSDFGANTEAGADRDWFGGKGFEVPGGGSLVVRVFNAGSGRSVRYELALRAQPDEVVVGDTTYGMWFSQFPGLLPIRPVTRPMLAIAYLEPLAYAGGTRLDLVTDGSTVTSTQTVVVGGPLDATSTARFPLSPDRSHAIRIRPPLVPGPFRFLVREVVMAPETASTTLRAGDSVRERIDYRGDVDEFTLIVADGEHLTLAARRVSGLTAPSVIEVLLDSRLMTTLNPAASPSGEPETYLLPAPGQYFVRIVPRTAGTLQATTGEYELTLRVAPRLPEEIPAVLERNRWASGETIGPGGDIDEFRVRFDSDTVAIFALRTEAGSGLGPFQATVIDRNGQTVAKLDVDGVLGSSPASHHRMTVNADEYTIRVEGNPTLEGRTPGAFSVGVFELNNAPESIPSAISLGQVVTGEALGHLGDVDVFSFEAEEGQRLMFFLRQIGPGERKIYATVSGQSSPTTFLAAPDIHLAAIIGPYNVPRTGTHSLKIEYRPEPLAAGEENHSYEILIVSIDTGPEMGPSVIASGDTIRGSIFPSGDIDIYRPVLEQGKEYAAFARLAPEDYGHLRVYFGHPDDDERPTVLLGMPAGIWHKLRGTYRRSGENPEGHLFEVRSWPQGGGESGPRPATGGFELTFHQINPANETLPTTIIPGRPTVGESVDTPGDVDTFEFTAQSNDRLVFSISTTVPIAFTVYAPSGQREVFSNGSSVQFLARETGTYRVRVEGHSDQMGSYSLTVEKFAP